MDIDLRTATAEQLNDWYEETVGYRPQVDDPQMTDDDLRKLCISYAEYDPETEEE